MKIANKKEWQKRLYSLNSQIQYWSQPEHKTDKTCEIVELYYDTV